MSLDPFDFLVATPLETEIYICVLVLSDVFSMSTGQLVIALSSTLIASALDGNQLSSIQNDMTTAEQSLGPSRPTPTMD